MNLKAKSWLYGISIVLILLVVNLLVLYLLNFPIMALDIIRSYWYLLVLLFSGLGIQVGLFTYFKNLNAITCSTTVTSGSISGISMILCCSHYLLNILPFLGALIGASALVALTKYTPYFLWLGVISNIVGVGVVFYQKKKYENKK